MHNCLIAFTDMDPNLSALVSSFLTMGVAGVAAAFVLIYNARLHGGIAKEDSAVKRYQEIADRLQKEIDKSQLEAKELRNDFRDFRTKNFEDILKLTQSNGECERRASEQDGEIKLLRSAMMRQQVDTGTTQISQPLIITADVHGKILNVSPTVAPMFHWLPKDLVCKNVEVLVPERLRAAARAGLEKLATGGGQPWPERVILTYGQTKDGDEIPIALTLTAWQTSAQEWLVSADIRQRPVSGNTKFVLEPATAEPAK